MTLLNRLFVFPLYYNGDTKFMPIYCSDLTEIIYQVISKNIISTTIRMCRTSKPFTLKDILKKIIKNLQEKKRLTYSFTFIFSKIICYIFSIIAKPIANFRSIKIT